MATAATIEDVRRLARRSLPRLAFDFIEGGADAELTLRRNLEAFERRVLRPRYLVDVSRRDTSATLLGQQIEMPLLIAPTGMSRVAGPDGDLAGVRAAGQFGVPFVLSTMSSHSIEDVARAASGPLWFQLYLWRQREIGERLVGRAKAAGFEVLVVTVDVPVVGRRVRDVHNGFVFPPKLRPRNALDMVLHPRWLAGVPRTVRFANLVETAAGAGGRPLEHAHLVNSLLSNPGASWADFSRLRALWDGPLLVKGLLTAEDALLAVDCGADGVIVSNHGGRQLDGTPASLDALEEIVAAVGGRTEVLVDGGIRRGTDVVKALALGARACLIGRPWLYGLAAGGEAGVVRVLELLRDELDRALALLGRPTIDALDRTVLTSERSQPVLNQDR
jgi:isopentenyl diphosphate isomerase/L-lactate dehydrogenase-like FMN-dependent dehydrogenase